MDFTKDIILQNKIHVPNEYTIRYICKYSSESRIMKKKNLKIEPLMDPASNYNRLESSNRGTS